MMENLFEEVKSHFNEPVLLGWDVGRIIGYAESDDCYMVVEMPRRGTIRHTMVGGYTYLRCLKGQGRVKSNHCDQVWDDYVRLDSLLELNGVPKQKEFIVDIED